MSKHLWVVGFLASVGAARAADDGLTDAQRNQLARYFGFAPFQIYKFSPAIQLLRLADLDRDGRTDIAIWNPYHNRIELLLQPKPDQSASPPAEPLDRNELPNRGTLRSERVPVSNRVTDLAIAELTGDDLPDLVFFGEPKEVVVLPQRADGGFGPPDSLRAPDGEARGGALAVGDFNGDGRTDVALLGQEVIQVFAQKAGGGLAKPLRIVHNIKQPLLMLATDLNGDGRKDLALSADDDQYGMYVLIQEAGGALGPLRQLKTPKFRSITFAHASGGDDLFAIEANSGRLKHYRWGKPEAASAAEWPLWRYSYPILSRSKRQPVAIGDVDGDGRVDCVAVDPDAAQVVLFRQGERGLEAGVPFPGLAKVSDVCLADVDDDNRAEVLTVSPAERMIGVSTYEEGRLTFPKAFPTQGEPLVATAGRLSGTGATDTLVYVSRAERKLSLRCAGLFSGEESQQLAIEDLPDEPAGLRFADVDQDGRNDLLLFVRFAPLRTFLQTAEGTFAPLTGPAAREGLVKEAPLEGFALADVTGDGRAELLLAQKNLARALVVRDGQWTVVDQYNPESADAELSGLAALPGTPGSPVLAMYDKKSRDLLAFRRRADQTYAVAQTMPGGTFELTAMEAAPLGPGGAPALLMADARTLALRLPDAPAETLIEQHSYESDLKDAWLADSTVGDVNGDGVRDVVVMEQRKANIEVLTATPSGALARAVRFQVFQGKRFSDAPDARGEPREFLLGDVTGDRVDDVCLLVHDRLLIYPGM